MISKDRRPLFRKKVEIKGNCLFLMGPIGNFFSRLSNYLEGNNVRTYKISFPLYEYGFPKSRLIKFNQDIYLFKNYLKKILIDKEIKLDCIIDNLGNEENVANVIKGPTLKKKYIDYFYLNKYLMTFSNAKN